MRFSSTILLVVAIIFGGIFWYDRLLIACDTPIQYRVGDVDERFGTSVDEVKRIAKNAEVMWENHLSAELFVYSESEDSLPINLIFDERQENAIHEAELRADLEAKEGMSESVAREYERLIAEFRALTKTYESRVVAYEASLKKYNSEVEEWNSKGGAPQHVVDTLRENEAALKEEQNELQALAVQINAIVSGLNRIGAKGNKLITDYNTIVDAYNREFSAAREFAQGDYTHDAINVYQFNSEEELTLVFAHEFGHALSLGHVANEASLMYHLMGEQSTKNGLTNEDVEEFRRVCEERPFFERVLRAIKIFFAV